MRATRGEGIERVERVEGLRVADLLLSRELGDYRLLSGASGLSRPLVWIHASSSREAADEVGPGILLIYSGGDFGADGGLSFLRELDAAGLAALAIPDAERLPQALVEEAESLDLPLLALPEGVGYRELSLSLSAILEGRGYTDPRGSRAELGAKPSLLEDLDAAMGDEILDSSLGLVVRGMRDWPEIKAALEAYFRAGGNAMAAAESLGIHRHTVKARLDAFEAASGKRLSLEEDRLICELAIAIVAARENRGAFPG